MGLLRDCLKRCFALYELYSDAKLRPQFAAPWLIRRAGFLSWSSSVIVWAIASLRSGESSLGVVPRPSAVSALVKNNCTPVSVKLFRSVFRRETPCRISTERRISMVPLPVATVLSLTRDCRNANAFCLNSVRVLPLGGVASLAAWSGPRENLIADCGRNIPTAGSHRRNYVSRTHFRLIDRDEWRKREEAYAQQWADNVDDDDDS
ncbi:unnamed protein product, partial [Iphiclides podalirius]